MMYAKAAWWLCFQWSKPPFSNYSMSFVYVLSYWRKSADFWVSSKVSDRDLPLGQ